MKRSTTLDFRQCNSLGGKAINLNLYLVFCSSPQPSRISTLKINWTPWYRLPAKFLSFSLTWKKSFPNQKNYKSEVSHLKPSHLSSFVYKKEPMVLDQPSYLFNQIPGPLLLSGNWPTSKPGAQWSSSVVRS